MIPEHIFSSIRQRVSLSSVVSRWVKLTRRGRVLKGLCPFHTEKTPSFTVDDGRGSYHCFGCGAHGDVVDFMRQQENLSFMEAISRLADQAGVSLPDAPYRESSGESVKALYGLVQVACLWFQQQLRNQEQALAYLEVRGISPADREAFQLGWAPSGGLIDHCTAQGYSLDMMTRGGLIGRSQGGRVYEWFRERLIFPITDDRGRVVAFGGRTLGKEDPKYLNSPETPIFVKGQCLYARPSSSKGPRNSHKTVVIVEGYFDVIAASGVVKAVAPLGTAVTADQLAMVWKDCDEPIICFDGDEAGARASLKVATMALSLLTPGRSVSLAQLPPLEDPHSLIHQRGMEAFQQILSHAVPLSQYLWAQLFGQEALTPEKRVGAAQLWRQWVATIQNPELRKAYQDFFYRTLRAQWERRKLKDQAVEVPISPSILIHQKILVSLLVLHPDLLEKVREEAAAMAFPGPSPWLTVRENLLSYREGVGLEESLSRCLGSQWRHVVSSALLHVPRGEDPSTLEAYWRDLFNAYQTQVYQKAEVASLAGQLFHCPESWDRLKALAES